MLAKPPGCNGCPLVSLGHGYATTDGTGSNGVMIIAEALGEDESFKGVPLVGRAGTLFNRMISRTEDPENPGVRLQRNDFVMTNVVNCRPPDNVLTGATYEHSAIDHCKPYVLEAIKKFQPRAIVAMGNQPMRWFTGQWGIEGLRGYRFAWTSPDGRVIPVVPTYHPSYLMRGNWEVVRVWQLDVLKALAISRGKQYDAPKSYETHPTPDSFRRFVHGYFDKLGSTVRLGRGHASEPFLLSFDIETPYIKGATGDKDEKWKRVLEDDMSWLIFRISFSYEPFKSISVPWAPQYLEGIQALLASSGDKLVWNRHFDVPRVAKAGCPAAGTIIDGMELWHFLEPSLPMGLKYVATFYCPDMQPWKLMSHSEPEWYNAADADTALRTTLAMVDTCKSQGRWDTFKRHVGELGTILDKLTIRGIAVDNEARARERERFTRLLLEEEAKLQPMIPDAVRPKKVYKSDADRLRRDGQWVDGRMVVVREALTDKEKIAWTKKMRSAEVKAVKAAGVAERKAIRAAAKAAKLSKPPATRRRKSAPVPTDLTSAFVMGDSA